jgi:hypothetical protein
LTRFPDAEPLIPEPPPVAPGSGQSVAMNDGVFDRRLNDPTPIAPRSWFLRTAVDLEVVLSEEEAARGGTCDIEVPVRAPCRRCAGTGVDWVFPCASCGARGWVAGRRMLRVRVPTGVRSGEILDVPSRLTGGLDVRLRLLIDRNLRAPPGR